MLIVSSAIGGPGSWHTGETLRIPEGRVITFQMDGHELYAVLAALRAAKIEIEYPAAKLTPIL